MTTYESSNTVIWYYLPISSPFIEQLFMCCCLTPFAVQNSASHQMSGFGITAELLTRFATILASVLFI